MKEGYKDFFINDRFATESGVELLEVGEGYAKARLLVTPKHLNAAGVCQGGAYFTLADLAFAAVANSHGKITLAINASIQFIKSVSDGYIYAEAVEVVNHRKLPYIDVKITDDNGDILAVYTSCGYRKEKDLIID